MLDLKTIFGMREQMLRQEGFLAFLLENWLILAIVIMVLGFVIDQVLYIVRYRPQDKIKRVIKGIKRFVLHVLEKEIPEEAGKWLVEMPRFDEFMGAILRAYMGSIPEADEDEDPNAESRSD